MSRGNPETFVNPEREYESFASLSGISGNILELQARACIRTQALRLSASRADDCFGHAACPMGKAPGRHEHRTPEGPGRGVGRYRFCKRDACSKGFSFT